MNHPPSSDIAARLADTKKELARVIATLDTVPGRKEAVLGASDFNERSLLTLEEEEAALTTTRDHLQQRIPLLERQAEQAAATRAQARIGQLVSESTEASKAYDRLLQEFHRQAAQLKLASEALIGAFRAHQALHDEQEYLLLRFEAAHLKPAALTFSPEKMPHEDDTADDILKPLQQFWQRQHSLAARNEWSRKRHDLENERQAQQQRQSHLTIPGHLATVR